MRDRRIIIRPPMEASSLLISVTAGCSHNKCWYCGIYEDQAFETEALAQIEKDLMLAKASYGQVERVFLANGDAFVLSASRLKAICEKIIAYFPEVKSIRMYSAIRNIRDKTDEELRLLRALRIDKLYVGLETGHPEIIAKINKGHDYDDAKTQLLRLKEANIAIQTSIMLGLGGKGRGLELARANADFLNQINPNEIFVITLTSVPDTQMTNDIEKGVFQLATEREILEEERNFIKLLELNDTLFWGIHIVQSVPVYGYFPQDKEEMILTIDTALETYDQTVLDLPIIRTGEGQVYIPRQ